MTGDNSGTTVLKVFDEAGLDYVEIDHDIFSNDEVWAKLTKFLLDLAAARRVTKRKGRPPGAGDLWGDPSERARIVHTTYAAISKGKKDGAATYWAEVARKLKVSDTTVWRVRNSPEYAELESA